VSSTPKPKQPRPTPGHQNSTELEPTTKSSVARVKRHMPPSSTSQATSVVTNSMAITFSDHQPQPSPPSATNGVEAYALAIASCLEMRAYTPRSSRFVDEEMRDVLGRTHSQSWSAYRNCHSSLSATSRQALNC